jgi:phosphate-selective porin OprO/OprP
MHDIRFTVAGRGRLGVAAGFAALILGTGQAHAAQASEPADTDALRAQVRELSAMVKALSDRDQQQINTLSAQVQALQSQLAQQTTSAATPRADQNTAGISTITGASTVAESGGAVPRVVQNTNHRFALQSSDGAYSIGLVGVAQFDSGDYLNFHADSPFAGPQALSNGVNARRARIGVAGIAGSNFSYAFIYDGGNSQDSTAKGIETAQIIFNGLSGAALEVGYSNTYFTLDQATSSSDLLFLERASPSNIATNFNAGDFRANAGARFFGSRYWVGAYVTGPATGDSHTTTGERLGAFERVAVQAVQGPDYSVHLGVGVDELLRAPNSGVNTANTLSLSDQPELRIDPTTLLNTGTIGTATHPVTGGYVIDVETAATWRGLFWQGEYYHYQVDRQGLANARFDGGYGQVSWTLTGETHKYNPQSAAYFRISPNNPFSLKDGGWGAWELAARYSYIDLNSDFQAGAALSANPAAIDGGRQYGYTVGVNWYPNELIRFMLDYNHVDYKKLAGSAASGLMLGAPVGSSFDAIALRAQISY